MRTKLFTLLVIGLLFAMSMNEAEGQFVAVVPGQLGFAFQSPLFGPFGFGGFRRFGFRRFGFRPRLGPFIVVG